MLVGQRDAGIRRVDGAEHGNNLAGVRGTETGNLRVVDGRRRWRQ